ncbi:MAG: hypothetical protein GF400_07735 [Candidatus Eisenbacteria bacterium]|nr:hypothetical protein [Candidatus Eisenbacteria bacterium]
MKTKTLLCVAVCACLGGALAGCGSEGPTDSERASELYLDGLNELYEEISGVDAEQAPWEWSSDVAEAAARFDEALTYDPDHCGALLGSALCHVLLAATDQELAEILDDLFPVSSGTSPRALFWYMDGPDLAAARDLLRERDDGFYFSVLQSWIETKALPELAIADERLSRFETLGCEVDLVVILPDTLGARDQLLVLDLDVTDAYFGHAAVDALQAACHCLASYDVDVSGSQTPQDVIEYDPDFLTLRANGHLPATYDEITSLGINLELAAESLAGETDGQSDDLITETGGVIELDELLEGSSVDLVRQAGEEIGVALATGMEVQLIDVDPTAPDVSVLVDLDELMNDPLADLREYLPDHSWSSPYDMVITKPVTLPDPTLDGITPDMENEDWAPIVDWLRGYW